MSQATRGTETRSQRRVRFEGVWAQGGFRVGEEGVAVVVGVVVAGLEGEGEGAGRLADCWLLVETIALGEG